MCKLQIVTIYFVGTEHWVAYYPAGRTSLRPCSGLRYSRDVWGWWRLCPSQRVVCLRPQKSWIPGAYLCRELFCLYPKP